MGDAEEGEDDRVGGEAPGAAAWVALSAAGRDKADRFLDEQTDLIRIQKEHLHEQRLLILSHLKWRRFEDQMNGALRIMLVALGGLAVVIVGAVLWNASRADGLVIESFSVPPSFSQSGVTGQVVADALTAKLAAIRNVAIAESFSETSDVSVDHGDEVRVEIPETGISVSQAWLYARNWLGHERHVSGSLSSGDHGTETLTIVVAGSAPISISGTNLDALETQTAEQLFARIDPVNAVIYLGSVGRLAEAEAAAGRYAHNAPGRAQISDAYGLWADATAEYSGDFALAVARARLGVAIDPAIAVTHDELGDHLAELGRTEEALHEYRAVSLLNAEDQASIRQEYGFAAIRSESERKAALLVGDYSGESAIGCVKFCSKLVIRSEALAHLHDGRGASIVAASGIAAGDVDAFDDAYIRYLIAADRGDWTFALHEIDAAIRAYEAPSLFVSVKYETAAAAVFYLPLRVTALAHLGRFAQARRESEGMPPRCVDCDDARGTVEALAGMPDAAAFWYARAIAEAPSIPFAYADWGEMLLRAGKCDAAIALFAKAHAKGPHFADPLEMWGEALMQENRSDLALPKFEEAAKYAPNWGRLHLEWGKALLWSGDRAGAQKQFVVAAHLDLTPSEKSELARTGASHG